MPPLDFQSIVDQALGVQPVPEQKKQNVALRSDDKKTKVDEASKRKQQQMGGDSYRNVAVGQRFDTGAISGTEFENDIRTMNDYELATKYGSSNADEIRRNILDASRQTDFEARSDERTGLEVTGDFTNSALSAVVNGVGGITGIGAGLVNEDAGAAIARGLGKFNEFTRSYQSDTLNDHRRLASDRSTISSRDNLERRRTDIANGDSPLVAKGKEFVRNAVDGFDEALDDPVLAVDTTAQGVGSLATGGAIGSALRKVGAKVIGSSTSKAAEILSKAGSKASQPVVIGALEGGSAYQATFNEMLNRGFSQEEANSAALKAAGIAAATGAAAGTLVSKIERAPFKVGSLKELGANVLKEAAEEGIQGATGQIAQNTAISDFDPNQDILEGAGKNAGAGAAAGILTTGAVQGPKAAVLAPVRGAGALANAGLESLKKRGDRVLAEIKAASPLSSESLRTAYDGVKGSLPELSDRLSSVLDNVKAEDGILNQAKDYVSNIVNRFTYSSDEVADENVPEVVRNTLDGAADRLDAIQRLSAAALDPATSPEDALTLGLELNKMIVDNQIANAQEDEFKLATKDNKADTEAVATVQKLRDVLSGLSQNPDVIAVKNKIVSLIDTVSDKLTPQNVNNVVKIAEYAPDKVNPDIADKILMHNERGDINLTPPQVAALKTSSTLARTMQDYEQRSADLKRTTPSVVSDQIISFAGSQTKQLSASEHMAVVVGAMKAGDTETAKNQLNDFMRFAKLMKNKVDALNTNLVEGDGTQQKGTKYMNLTERRVERLSAKGMWLNPLKARSIEFAQQVEADAKAVITLANNLATVFPELGIKPIDEAALVPELQGEATKIAAVFRDLKSAGINNADSRNQEVAKPKADDTNTPAPVKVERKQTVSEETDQSKRDDKSTEIESEESILKEHATRITPKNLVAERDTLDASVIDNEGRLWSLKPLPGNVMGDHGAFFNYLREKTGNRDAERNRFISVRTFGNQISTDGSRVNEKQAATLRAIKLQAQRSAIEYVGLNAEENYKSDIVESKPEPVEEVIEEPAPEKVERVKPDTTEIELPVEVKVEPIAEAETTTTKVGLPSVFPNLNKNSVFTIAYKAATNARTRIFGTGAPLRTVIDALSSTEALRAFVGREDVPTLNDATVKAYQEYLKTGVALKAVMDKSLETALNTVQKGKTFREVLLESKGLTNEEGQSFNIAMTSRYKAFNIVDVVDGKMGYNPELAGSAILAGLQWLLIANNFKTIVDAEKAANIFGIDESQVYNTVKIGEDTHSYLWLLNSGLSATEAKRSLARMVKRYWGVTANTRADKNIVDGIAEAVAAEILDAMVQTKMLTATEFTVEGKDYIAYTPFRFKKNDPRKILDTLIEETVQVEAEKPVQFSPPAKASATQIRNTKVKNSPEQIAAIKAESSTPYRLNKSFGSFISNLELKDIFSLFGEGDLDSQKLNKNDRASKEGKNTTLESAYNSVLSLMGKLQNEADKTGKDVGDVEVFYDHNFTSVSRLQMLGLNNPQASKLMREVMLPMESVLDMTNPQTARGYMVALAQALDIKVHNQSAVDSENDVLAKLNGDLKPAVDMFRGWLKQNKKLSPADLKIITDAFGGSTDPVSLHAVMDYANFLNEKEAGRTNEFKTKMYIEADGVTNGAIMATMMMSVGNFSTQFLANIAKGGVFLHNHGDENQPFTTNEYRTVDKIDLYEKASKKLYGYVSALKNSFGRKEELHNQMNYLINLMEVFFKDVEFKYDADNDSTVIEFKRGITKNPLTITLYGSGEYGIADKIVTELSREIYARLSDAAQIMADNPDTSLEDAMFGSKATPDVSSKTIFNNFITSLEGLSNKVVLEGKDKKYYVIKDGDVSFNAAIRDVEGFTFDKVALQNMTRNMMMLFVKPMTKSIEETMGRSLIDPMTALRKATQVTSIMVQYAYAAEVAKRLEGKPRGTYLSQEEEIEIFESLSNLAPFVKADGQTFLPSKARTGEIKRNFGHAMNDKFQTNGEVETYTDAGVRGIPMMIIGMGDGKMMQIMATMQNAVKNTLKVFDGVNIGISSMAEGSRQANEAAYQAMLGNPLKAVSESFGTLVSNASFENMNEAQLDALSRSLFTGWKDTKTKDEIVEEINRLNSEIAEMALSSEARHNVLRKVKVSVDQMAAVGSPYISEGSIDLSNLDSNQITLELNRLYEEEFDKLKGIAPKTNDIAEELGIVGSKANNGVTVLVNSQLKRLLPTLNITPEQKDILRQVVKSLTIKDYNIVSGPISKIAEWAGNNGAQSIPAETRATGKIHGLVAFGDKVIYVTNNSPETLIHELIHASTFEAVVDYYTEGGSISAEQGDAIQRIEGLMNQFLELDRPEPAYNQARNVIEAYLTREDAVSKASALNEYMAWALSNEQIIKVQKETKVENPLVRLTKATVAAIKNLVWGRQVTLKVADDIHSNLLFNTAIITTTAPTVQDIVGEVSLFHNSTYGNDPRLLAIEEAFERKIVDNLDVDLKDYTERNNARYRAVQLARETTRIFDNYGFPMNDQQKSVFNTVVAALATQAELDPNSLNGVQTMYDHVIKNLTLGSFLSDPATQDQNEINNAQIKFDTIVGNRSKKKDAYGRSTLLSSFLALSMVNDDFRKVLRNIPLPNNELAKWNTTDNVLDNLGTLMMDKLSNTMNGVDRRQDNVADAISVLTDNIVEIAQDKQSFMTRMLRPVGAAVNYLNDNLVSGIATVSEKTDSFAKSVSAKTNNKIITGSVNAVNLVTSFITENGGEAIQAGTMSQVNKSNMPRVLQELMNEFIGRTSENATVYDMIKMVRSRVQQYRQQYRDNMPKHIASKFTRDLTDVEYTSMFKGLAKTDIAALLVGGNIDSLLDLVLNAGTVSSEIKKLEKQIIAANPKTGAQMLVKAKELADYMNTGKYSGNFLRNATAISNLWNEYAVPAPAPASGTVELIDKVTSLYALQSMDADTKATLVELTKEQTDGVRFVMANIIGQRKDEIDRVYRSGVAIANHYKGYVPSQQEAGASLLVVDSVQGDQLIKRGYERIGDYVGSKADSNNKKLGYYYSTTAEKPMFNQGIIQNIRHTASGIYPVTGYTNSTMIAGRVEKLDAVKRAVKLMRVNTNNTEPLLPVFNANGGVVAFERAVDPEMDAKLNRDTNIAKAIGAWAGRHVEEAESGVFNQILVDRLKAIWDKEKTLKKDEYVNLFGDLNDPVLQDAVGLFTPEVRAMINKAFPDGEFWVRKDMVTDAVGYRAASVSDMWTGNSRWSPEAQKSFQRVAYGVFGKDAYKRLVTAERFVQNFVTDARVTIVVKSVIVPMANLAANFIQLMTRGVPIQDIVRGMPKKAAEIKSFTEGRVKRIELEAELRAVTNDLGKTRRIQAEIQAIRDANRRMSIWPLIKAGEFASISDVGVDSDQILLAEGRLNAYIESLTAKLPPSVRTFGRYAVVAKDTSLYKGLQRAVEYGDFLGKAVLYDHLTKAKGLEPSEALAKITEEFVNYDRLPGRDRAYMENIGLMWFWNFKIRSAKIAASMIRNNPVHLLMTVAVPTVWGAELPGSPITDNAVSVMTDGRFEYSLGIDQAIHAHNLNPWMNAVG